MGHIREAGVGGLCPAALSCCVLVLVAGCGGTTHRGGSNAGKANAAGSTSHRVDTAFAARATAACQQGNQLNMGGSPPPYPKFDPQQPDVAELPAMGRWIETGVAPARQALSLAERLGQPASGAAAWNRFLTAADSWLVELQTQATSAEHGQVQQFIATTRALQTDLDGYRGAAVNAGVPDCGGIFGPQGP